MRPIYTRRGDTGLTSLFESSPISKKSPKIEAIGQLDELNAALSVAHSFLKDTELKNLLHDLQTKLFEIGAQLADAKKYQITVGDVKKLEETIDFFEAQLKPIKHFVFPGGNQGAAFLHLARAICRRAERSLAVLHQKEKLNPNLMSFMNRLSDLLFILARIVNKRCGFIEHLWSKKD